MKKTLVLTHEYYPFKGGVARYCHNLFKYFDKNKYLVITDNSQVLSQDNIVNTKLTWKWFKPSWLPAYLKLKKIIKRHNIEQIFTPNILPLGTLAYALKIPYVISLHGLDINLALEHKPKLTKRILAGAKAIITNTKNTAGIIEPLGIDKTKIYVVYPGLDFSTDYDPIKLAAWRNKLEIGNEKILLTLGRLNKRKGQDLVIEALGKIKEEYNLKYFIVGRGEEKDNLKALIDKNNLSKRVFIFDNIGDEDLIYFFRMADIFVMPHRQIGNDIEGLGIVFLEAALCKRPIISGNTGGIKEIFNNNQAILLENSDLKMLIKALRQLLNNPQEAVKLANSAYNRVMEFKDSKTQALILKDILK